MSAMLVQFGMKNSMVIDDDVETWHAMSQAIVILLLVEL